MEDVQVQVEIVKALSAIGTAAIAALSAYIGVKYTNNKDKDKDSNSKEEPYKIKLINHPVFTRIEFNKNMVMTGFEFKNKGKETIFKEILVQHLNIYKETLKDLCEHLDEKEMDTNELLNRSVTAISNIMVKLQNFYVNDDSFTAEEKKVLKIVLDKYHTWDMEREQKTLDMISNICGSAFYPTTYAKAVTILDMFLFFINDTIEDANKTLNGLNGDLKGLKFKGVVI